MSVNRSEGISPMDFKAAGDQQIKGIAETGKAISDKSADLGKNIGKAAGGQSGGIEDLQAAKPQEPKSAGGIEAGGAASKAEIKPS